jgi:hypothetical protein
VIRKASTKKIPAARRWTVVVPLPEGWVRVLMSGIEPEPRVVLQHPAHQITPGAKTLGQISPRSLARSTASVREVTPSLRYRLLV